MGERYEVTTYLDYPADALFRTFEEGARLLDGVIRWQQPADETCRGVMYWQAKGRLVTTVLSSYYGYNPVGLLKLWVGWRLNLVWLEVCVQEGTLWCYTLYRGEEVLDRFSVWPEYWDLNVAESRKWRGSPPVLADAFGVDVTRIERYLRPWKMRQHKRSGFIVCLDESKAYPEDDHCYGDWHQMFDLMRTLGIPDPFAMAPYHSFSLREVNNGEAKWRELKTRLDPQKEEK